MPTDPAAAWSLVVQVVAGGAAAAAILSLIFRAIR